MLTCGLLGLHDGGDVLLVGSLLGASLGVLVLLSRRSASLSQISRLLSCNLRRCPTSSGLPHGRSHAGYHGPSWLKGSRDLLREKFLYFGVGFSGEFVCAVRWTLAEVVYIRVAGAGRKGQE